MRSRSHLLGGRARINKDPKEDAPCTEEPGRLSVDLWLTPTHTGELWGAWRATVHDSHSVHASMTDTETHTQENLGYSQCIHDSHSHTHTHTENAGLQRKSKERIERKQLKTSLKFHKTKNHCWIILLIGKTYFTKWKWLIMTFWMNDESSNFKI